jgi:hypothetical protein
LCGRLLVLCSPPPPPALRSQPPPSLQLLWLQGLGFRV